MASPGKAMTQGACRSSSRPPDSMAPHSGVGGWAPKPKKLNPAASRMAVPKLSVAWTMSGTVQLGKML